MTTISTKSGKVIKVVSCDEEKNTLTVSDNEMDARVVGAEYAAEVLSHYGGFQCCEKVISFGDAMNDIDVFNISDEAYAVANAFDELKQLAKGVIDSNNDDGVAKWLDNNMNGDVSIGQNYGTN